MFQPQCNLVAGCALGATGEIGPTLWKAPAFEDAGAIGKRNQASERWLPPREPAG